MTSDGGASALQPSFVLDPICCHVQSRPIPHHIGICWGFYIPTWFLDIHSALLFVIISSHYDHRSLQHLPALSQPTVLSPEAKGNPDSFSCYVGTTGLLLWLPVAASLAAKRSSILLLGNPKGIFLHIIPEKIKGKSGHYSWIRKLFCSSYQYPL